MNENLVIVFTRNPELGKVKTRLAKTIGGKAALNIYKFLLNHTETTIRNIDCDKAIYYSVKIRDNDIWDDKIYQKHLQKGEDLGLKMLNAFQNAFKNNYNKVVKALAEKRATVTQVKTKYNLSFEMEAKLEAV